MPSEIARNFLKTLQEQEYAALGSKPPVYDKNTLLQGVERQGDALEPGGQLEQELRATPGCTPQISAAILRQLREAHSQTGSASDELVARSFDLRPTPYEDPTHFAILNRLNGSLTSADVAYPEFNFAELRERVTVGTLPTAQFNASTIAVPGTKEFLIVFDPVFFAFINLLSQAIAPALRKFDARTNVEHDARLRDLLKHEPFLLTRFEAVLLSFLILGRPPIDAPIAAEDTFVVERLRNEATLFALAHEYGHILLGHFRHRPPPEGPDPRGWQKAWSYHEEHSADTIASDILRIVINANGLEPVQCLLGADFFLLSVMLIEAAREILLTGKKRTLRPPPEGLVGKGQLALWLAERNFEATHPKSFHRWAILYGWIKQQYPTALFAGIDGNAQYLFDAAEVMWEACVSKLIQAHTSGLRPTREWRGYSLWETPM